MTYLEHSREHAIITDILQNLCSSTHKSSNDSFSNFNSAASVSDRAGREYSTSVPISQLGLQVLDSNPGDRVREGYMCPSMECEGMLGGGDDVREGVKSPGGAGKQTIQ